MVNTKINLWHAKSDMSYVDNLTKRMNKKWITVWRQIVTSQDGRQNNFLAFDAFMYDIIKGRKIYYCYIIYVSLYVIHHIAHKSWTHFITYLIRTKFKVIQDHSRIRMK